MPMRTTRIHTTVDTTREASTADNIKTSTTMINTMTKEHPLLVSNHTRGSAVGETPRRNPRHSATSP